MCHYTMFLCLRNTHTLNCYTTKHCQSWADIQNYCVKQSSSSCLNSRQKEVRWKSQPLLLSTKLNDRHRLGVHGGLIRWHLVHTNFFIHTFTLIRWHNLTNHMICRTHEMTTWSTDQFVRTTGTEYDHNSFLEMMYLVDYICLLKTWLKHHWCFMYKDLEVCTSWVNCDIHWTIPVFKRRIPVQVAGLKK